MKKLFMGFPVFIVAVWFLTVTAFHLWSPAGWAQSEESETAPLDVTVAVSDNGEETISEEYEDIWE